MSSITRRIIPLRFIAVFLLGVVPLLGPVQPSRAAVSVGDAPVAVPAALHAATGGHSKAAYEREVQSLAAEIARRLGRPLGLPITFIMNKIQEKPTLLMNAAGLDEQGGQDGTPVQCRIGVYPLGDALQGRDWSVALAHEVWHCYQAVLLGLPQLRRFAGGAQTQWIIEGQAQWVGEMVAGPDAPEARSWWYAYLFHPQTPLFTRTYDALGFYAHVAERCGGAAYVWSILPGMLDKIPDNLAAYGAATAGCDAGFLDSWASGFFRDPARGAEWDTTGPAIPSGGTAAAALREKLITLANGQEEPLFAGQLTNGIYLLTSQADILRVGVLGHARLSDAGSTDHLLAGEMAFCTRAGGCACPTGSAYQGPPLTPLTSPVDFALTGGPEGTGTRVSLAGLSLDTFCQKKPVPLPPGPGGALPNPCKLVTLSDVEDIVGRNPDYIYSTIGPVGSSTAPLCEHLVVGGGITGAVAVALERRAATKYSGGGTAITGVGDEAYLQVGSDFARLIAAKGHILIIIQVTMGARSTQIALAVGHKAVARL